LRHLADVFVDIGGGCFDNKLYFSSITVCNVVVTLDLFHKDSRKLQYAPPFLLFNWYDETIWQLSCDSIGVNTITSVTTDRVPTDAGLYSLDVRCNEKLHG